jgi:hypothetical protein
MRCEHEATLAKPSEDMLMGCTRAADLILPLSMVASLRHQSIINKRIDDYMTRSLSPWNSNFSRLFLKLRPVRLAFQPPASSTFLSQQISHQQPASSTLLSEQTSTSHQPPANRTGCLWAKNSRTQINKCINYLPGKGEHQGLDLSLRCLLLPSFLVST